MSENEAAKKIIQSLTKTGIKPYRETAGRHEWVVWRRHLHEVAPLLFR